jgi:hypothetical protein
MYPAGIAARIPMMSFSKLSSEAGFELYETIAVIAKLSLTFVVESLIKTVSMYGVEGTTTIAGGMGDSGTKP